MAVRRIESIHQYKTQSCPSTSQKSTENLLKEVKPDQFSFRKKTRKNMKPRKRNQPKKHVWNRNQYEPRKLIYSKNLADIASTSHT